MRWIATQTVSGTGTGSITFNNIPQDFQWLRIHLWGRGTFNNAGSGLSVLLSFNGGGTPQFRHNVLGNGSTASLQNFSGTGTVGSIPDVTATSTIYGANIFDLFDYSNSNKNKTIKWIGGFDRNGSGAIVFGSSYVTQTTPINTITLNTDGNWGDGSRADLYGFTSNPIATGA